MKIMRSEKPLKLIEEECKNIKDVFIPDKLPHFNELRWNILIVICL